jgi:hypothetical protein
MVKMLCTLDAYWLSTKHSRPHHHMWQVYRPVNSDASELNNPTSGPHDVISAVYKTCVCTCLNPMLGLSTTVQRCLIASASETCIDRKIMILWLDGHGSEATAWCSWSAMPWSSDVEPSSATGAPISAKLSGPATCEASHWGQCPRWGSIGTLLVSGALSVVLAFRPRAHPVLHHASH